MKNLKLIDNETLSKSKSLLVGTWQANSLEADDSKFVLKLNNDSTFEGSGHFSTGKKKAICLDSNKHFVIDVYITFNTNGKYFLFDQNEINFTGNINIKKEITCRENLAKTGEFIVEECTQKTSYINKFNEKVLEKNNKLYFQNPFGVIGFKAGVFGNSFVVKGFIDFVRI